MTGDEEQIGGFDLIYKNKRIKQSIRNISFLGCMNNRMAQMRKMAKSIALRLAEKPKELTTANSTNPTANNKNVRNKSTMNPPDSLQNKTTTTTAGSYGVAKLPPTLPKKT